MNILDIIVKLLFTLTLTKKGFLNDVPTED